MNKDVITLKNNTGTDTVITRVEVIGTEGREFIKYLKEGATYDLSLQDDGRTLKIFEKPYEDKIMSDFKIGDEVELAQEGIRYFEESMGAEDTVKFNAINPLVILDLDDYRGNITYQVGKAGGMTWWFDRQCINLVNNAAIKDTTVAVEDITVKGTTYEYESLDISYFIHLGFKGEQLSDKSGSVVDFFKLSTKNGMITLELRPSLGYEGEDREHTYTCSYYSNDNVDSIELRSQDYKKIVGNMIKVVALLEDNLKSLN